MIIGNDGNMNEPLLENSREDLNRSAERRERIQFA